MRGRILGADAAGGMISAEDGKRYRFAPEQWRSEGPAAAGDEVDFDGADGVALDVFSLKPVTAAGIFIPAAVTGPASQSQGVILGVVSLVCGLLGFVPGFGSLFSVVAFFLGRYGQAKAIAASDTTGALLCKMGMILGAVVFVFAVLVLLIGGAGLLGLMFAAHQ